MTGITQTPDRNTSPRPEAGRRSLQAEEVAIRRRLNECDVEAFVEEHWSKFSPRSSRPCFMHVIPALYRG